MKATLKRFLSMLAMCGILTILPDHHALKAQPDATPSVKVVTYGTGMGAWCLYAAQFAHYFDAAGVKLGTVFSLIGDPNIVSALTSGQADIAIGSVGAIVPFAN